MFGKVTRMQKAEFKRPDGVVIAAMGILIIAAAIAGVVMAALLARSFDLKTIALIGIGFLGASALGAGFINAWRTPMLTVRPDALKVPTFFGAREIPIREGHPIGEFLAVSDRGSVSRPGTVEANKFVHFYTLDGEGALTELAALHRAAPMIGQIRRAFAEVAGLKLETLQADPKSKRARPDVAHWKSR